ncbi:lipase member I isoform X4 [Cervus canadensis]|uniref:lipase member I isoform X4 n=1 Tax=Cervus canadensis TaxID=1574408 RepID=UPI001C9E85D5|nr:lipase member I isoform X4 [Cervus canadensis]
MNFRISFLVNLSASFTFIRFQMRVYIFLCLMCWARSENKAPCLEFSQLSLKDSFRDLFNPKMEISLMLYTRNNPTCAELLFEKNDSLNVNFNTSKKAVWLIHGYRPLGSTPSWLQNFVRILLNQDDMNIIVVDWNRGATTFLYIRAVKNTRKVAVSLSRYIQNLLKHGASLDNFHFIGVSLGAHISGFVGKIFHGRVGRITGLDPAGPQFSGKPANGRLDYTDANFVDVIHTDTNGLGIKQPLGHIDFYPNGGKKQPGCPKSIFSAYYFVLSIVVLDENMKDGYVTFKLLNQLGIVEEPRLYERHKIFYKLQEFKILGQFLNDVANISSIGLAYFQSSNQQCSTCKYTIRLLKLKSLTYPESYSLATSAPRLAFSRTLYKWNHMVCCLLNIASFI